MGGVFKGIAVGLASFGLGFAVLSVLLPPEEKPSQSARTAVQSEAPEQGPEALSDTLVPEDIPAPVVVAPPAPVDDEPVAVQPALADAAEGDEPAAEDQSASDEAIPSTPIPAEPLDDAAPTPVDDEPAAMAQGPVDADTAGDPLTEAPESQPAGDVAPSSDETEVPLESAAVTLPIAPVEEGTAADAEAALPDADEATAAVAPPPVLRAVPSSPGLSRAVEGVTVGRLPSISGGTAPPGEPDAATTDDAPDPALPAHLRYAAAHEPGIGPLFSVILLDAPADAAAEAALLALPFGVSIALDPGDPDAPRRAAAYRDAGHEIVMLAAGLPLRATPSDLEVTFDGWFRALPETVALLDTPEGGFQGNRVLAQQIMPFLHADGHGLITQERGLNPAQQSARSAGVASAAVFRIIDSEGENQFTIRRYLDRATFRAQQEGNVVVMGRAAHADTIAGLIGWRMEGRAGEVTIAPVSAILASQ